MNENTGPARRTTSLPARSGGTRDFVWLRDPGALPAHLAGPVVAIGNFDGVHLGHRRVIERALAMAAERGRPSAVLTFDPHPRDFFQPGGARFRLTPPDAQAGIIESLGVAALITLSFNEALASLSAEAFLNDVLVKRLGVAGVAAGADFHYGKGRGGSPATLREGGVKLGFAVEIVEQLEGAAGPISSTRIRQALAAGDIAAANAMLGYEWFARGAVIHGQKLGRTLGFPTANIALEPGCALRHGVYAVRARLEGRVIGGVASFGRRPTFDNGAPLLEIFLFDFSGDLYGKTLDVAFVAFLREEMKFGGVEPLVAQMEKDSAEARRILAAE